MQDGIIRGHNLKVITITPTVETAAYADGDVGVNNIEIPNAVIEKGGASRLLDISMVCKDTGLNPQGEMYFQTNSQSWGTVNAQVSITDAQMFSAGILGWFKIQSNDFNNVGSSADSSASVFKIGTNDTDPAHNGCILQAAADSTSVYFSFHPSNAWDFESTTDLQISFHIAY